MFQKVDRPALFSHHFTEPFGSRARLQRLRDPPASIGGVCGKAAKGQKLAAQGARHLPQA
ncbi:MAG: hypothetical protein GTO53_10780 [Planctomycetales bacterium]|nr:hypothetical protein [Planctomycetales bacterium]NIM09603.1 hypothetical protein [Planctomycetales bacterium]NIN09092.1 hypothetical protein [Planctomycetales bacterium]NIN76619.1 hypothetical protein [Planctomycetales bacterium]NIP05270.1 hypothetical protein [Planctomycetales bacterium]